MTRVVLLLITMLLLPISVAQAEPMGESPLAVINKTNGSDASPFFGKSSEVLDISKKYTHKRAPVWSGDGLWCARYVNRVLSEAGIRGTGSDLGRSFLHWGVDTTSNPKPGDVVVLTRKGRGGKSHVGFFVKFDGDRIVLHSGNTSDGTTRYRTVAETSYDRHRLLGIRRAPVQVASLH